MRRIVHISDLHFGNNDAALLRPLREAIQEIQPHLVVVCGDLVEHATAEEFRQAREFLDSLPYAQLVVPGNHDLPFYNLWSRAVVGLARYRRAITAETQPRFDDGELTVIGANTSRLWPIRGGSLSSQQLESLAEEFRAAPQDRMRILVTHHPFDLPQQQDRRLIVGHARRAICRLAPFVDILLAGHIHVSSTGSTATRYKTSGYAIAFVQAGTAVSRRDKGERNSFNAITVETTEKRKSATVETWTWKLDEFRFARRCCTEFRLEDEGWRRMQTAAESKEEIYEVPGESKP